LNTLLPGRPRSYIQLGCHVFQVLEIFLDLVESGRRVEFDDYFQPVPSSVTSRSTLLTYCGAILVRFNEFAQKVAALDPRAKANVYYGEQTIHEFLERSVWHAAQHTRQIQVLVEKSIGPVSNGLQHSDLEGLPLPDHIYDDKVAL